MALKASQGSRMGRPGHSNIGDAFSKALILPLLCLTALFILHLTEDNSEQQPCRMIAMVIALGIYDIEQFHHFWLLSEILDKWFVIREPRYGETWDETPALCLL